MIYDDIWLYIDDMWWYMMIYDVTWYMMIYDVTWWYMYGWYMIIQTVQASILVVSQAVCTNLHNFWPVPDFLKHAACGSKTHHMRHERITVESNLAVQSAGLMNMKLQLAPKKVDWKLRYCEDFAMSWDVWRCQVPPHGCDGAPARHGPPHGRPNGRPHGRPHGRPYGRPHGCHARRHARRHAGVHARARLPTHAWRAATPGCAGAASSGHASAAATAGEGGNGFAERLRHWGTVAGKRR